MLILVINILTVKKDCEYLHMLRSKCYMCAHVLSKLDVSDQGYLGQPTENKMLKTAKSIPLIVAI